MADVEGGSCKTTLVQLQRCKRTSPRILADMAVHYSQPKGFVGRNICYEILVGSRYYGAIVGGSATLHLPGRDEFFGVAPSAKQEILNYLVNNIFFHIEPRGGKYPIRNMVSRVLTEFRQRIIEDWERHYGDPVFGFETLVELPRTGEAYLRDGWVEIGLTKGFTCKRVGGKGSDSWSGQRVWDQVNLRPKRVFVRSAYD